jgi:PAS domain S-box-containing protein
MSYPRNPHIRYVLLLLVFALIYFAAGRIGFLFANTAGNVTLIWPPTGIALAVILRFGYRYWPMIVIGAVLLNVSNGVPLLTALLISSGNILEALGAVFLLRRSGFDPSFNSVQNVVRFIGLAVLCATTFSATIGVAALCLTVIQSWEPYAFLWWIWWLGDVMSALVLAPVLLLWSSGDKPRIPHARRPEVVLFLALLTAVSLLIFDTSLVTSRLYPLIYISFGFVLWASLRFSLREVATASLIISVIAIAGTIRNAGPFFRVDLSESLLYLWSYISAVGVTALMLAAALTERERAQTALIQTEARFRSVFEGATVGIAVIEYDGHSIAINETLTRMFGYSEAEMKQITFRDLTHPDDIPASEEAVRKVLDGEIPYVIMEKRYIRKNGEIMWGQLNVSLFPGEVGGKKVRVAIIQDITERKRAELAVIESEARFRAIFNGAIVGIAVADWNGHILTANQRLTQMLGYTEAELQELTFGDLTYPDDNKLSAERVEQVMTGELPYIIVEKRYVRKNGEIMWAQANVSLFPGQLNGRKVRITIVQDITERKRAELALNQLNTELEQRVTDRTAELSAANERLTELDRLKSKFIADVSHELRTPLTVLNTRVYLLERSRPEQWDGYLTSLRDQIERLTRFVNTILDLSRLELGGGKIEFSPVDLNEVVEQVSDALAPRAESSGLRLNVECSHGLPRVRGEFNQLAQVATNLIANAINYTPNGRIDVHTLLRDEQIGLKVQDTGMGISATDLSHLFERFYRGEKAGQTNLPGSGLGLSIVKEIVDLHGGKIDIESTVGKGTTFTVWLPVWEKPL